MLNTLSPNPKKWSNTLKQFVNEFLTHCSSVFDYFVGLAIEGLREKRQHSLNLELVKSHQDSNKIKLLKCQGSERICVSKLSFSFEVVT